MTGGPYHHKLISKENGHVFSRRTRAEELAFTHFDFKVLIDAPCVMIEPAIGSDTLGRDWHRGARGVGK